MILVTGGTGLVGSHLLFDLLSAGKKVRVLVRQNSNRAFIRKVFSWYSTQADELFNRIEWAEGDVLDPLSLDDALQGVDYVFHAAASVSFQQGGKKQLIQTNVKGTANLVNACLDKQIKKFCHVSSIASLGEPEDDRAITETDVWTGSKGRSAYSISKFYSEMEVWRGFYEGLPMVMVNPSVIIGPGNWHNSSAQFFSQVHKGMRFYTSGGTGFVDVRDVSKACIMLMDSDLSGERFILNSENTSYKTVLDSIAQSLGKPVPKIKAQVWMLGIAWRLAALGAFILRKNPALTKETAQSAIGFKTYSSQKISNKLGLSFIPVNESIQHTARIFKLDNGLS